LTEKLGYAGSRLFSTALERCAEMSSVINKRTLYDHLGGVYSIAAVLDCAVVT